MRSIEAPMLTSFIPSKLFETKGLSFLDKEKAKHHAKEEARREYESRYEN